MRKKHIGIILTLIFPVGLLMTATAWGADVVKIGYSGPLSGGAAKYGKNCEAGMILAMD